MDNFSKQLFAKDIEELELEDIKRYFSSEKNESDKLEFKAFHNSYGNFQKNLEGVIRGICAFLNSDGGILIWGAPLGQKKDNKTIFFGNLSPVIEFIDKDTFISKISDSITPLPTSISLKIIELDKKYIYIFQIQKSKYSPHQYKNTYWARLDGQTKPAPHYLIEALFKKIQFPNIEGYLRFDKYRLITGNISHLTVSVIIINFSEFQNESCISYQLVCEQATFKEWRNHIPMNHSYYDLNGHLYASHNYNDILHFGAPEIIEHTLEFDIESLIYKNNGEMDFTLAFGGKSSPLKFSIYKLDLSGNIQANNLSTLIVNKEENILASNRQDILGTNKQDILHAILNR